MPILDALRYGLALIAVLVFPFAILFWYLVHPWIAFWRRLGPALTYGLLVGAWIVVAVVTWAWRDVILAVEYGTRPALWIGAAISYGIAVVIEVRCRRHLKASILVGMPELRPAEDGGRLLQEGIYGRIRHPRYVAVTFSMLAIALFCNYLATWILAVLTPFALAGVVRFEERELEQRFGEAWIEYRSRVPACVPRRGR